MEVDEDESQSLLSSSKILKFSKNALKRLESYVDSSTSESSNVVVKETTVIKRRSIYDEIIKLKRAASKKENQTVDLTSCSEGMNLGNNSNLGESTLHTSVSQPMFGELSSRETKGIKKGSFLSRGSLMLGKLAEISKPGGDAVSNVKNNSRNFVFQHITPPNVEKVDGTTSRVKRVCGLRFSMFFKTFFLN